MSARSTVPTTLAKPPGVLKQSLIVAGAYIAGGVFSIATGMITSGPSGQTSAVWLPPGIALAALLVWGRRCWWGVWLGSLVLSALISYADAPAAPPKTHIALTLLISAAMAAQAVLSSVLVRRFSDPVVALDRAATVARFLLCSAVASLVTSSIGSLACVAFGTRELQNLPFDWPSWWASDTISVFLVTPVLLAWIASPAELWRPRRLQLTLPLGVTLAIASMAFVQANRVESERLREDLTLRADRLEVGIQKELAKTNESANAVRDLLAVRSRPSQDEFHTFAGRQLERNQGISSIAWLPHVLEADRDVHEANRRADRLPAYQIREFDRFGALVRAGPRGDYFPLEFVEANVKTDLLLGLDLASLPERRRLLEESGRTRQLTMSEPLQLVSIDTDRLGILVAVPAVARDAHAIDGFVVCAVRVTPFLRPVLSSPTLADLDVHLRDLGASPAHGLLWESSGQRPVVSKFYETQRDLRSNGRTWRLELAPTPAYLRAHRGVLTQAVSIVGFTFAALLCGFLLVTTGRSANIQQQVTERTHELSQANAKLREEIEVQRRMERALKESEVRWQFAVEEAGEGAWDWNLEAKQLFWSPRLTEMMGYAPGELDDSLDKWSTSVHPEDLARVQTALDRHLAGETTAFATELRMRRRNGSWIWIATHAKVVRRDAEGRPLRLIGIQTDITSRRLAEEELNAHRGHLERLVQERTAELEVAKGVAEQANLAKSLFLANMSHELRTPMHAILAYARLALDREPAGKLAEFLNRIVVSGERLLLLLNDLLDLSKLEARKTELDLAPHDLEGLAREVVAELEPLLREKHLDVAIERAAGCDDCIARVDRRKVSQAFHNILANAVRFSAEHAHIAVRFAHTELPPSAKHGAREQRRALEVSFADEGIGIPEAELESIFDSFVQSSKTRTNAGGTGLGLAICKQIAELHHGSVKASNNAQSGATFTFTIPLERGESQRIVGFA